MKIAGIDILAIRSAGKILMCAGEVRCLKVEVTEKVQLLVITRPGKIMVVCSI